MFIKIAFDQNSEQNRSLYCWDIYYKVFNCRLCSADWYKDGEWRVRRAVQTVIS